MTNKMKEDLIKALRRKIVVLAIVCAVLAMAVVGLIIFIAWEYEIAYEEYEEYVDYEIVQDTGDGEGAGDNYAIVDSTVEESDPVSVICGTAITCVIIIMVGVIIYGKTSNKNKKENNTPSGGASS